MHRQGLLAIRLGHQYRTTLTQVMSMVTSYVNIFCEKHGSPRTAKTLSKGLKAAKKAMGHDNERKALPMFRLQFLSWCIQLDRTGQLQNRLAATYSDITADSAVLTCIRKMADDLEQDLNCNTAVNFRGSVKSVFLGLLADDKIAKARPLCWCLDS